jgi:plastocyanin
MKTFSGLALALAMLTGCTVGDGGGGTLSGGASAGATAATTNVGTSDDDGSSDHAPSDDDSSDGGGEEGSTTTIAMPESTSGGESEGSSSGSSDGGTSTTGDDLADGILDITIVAHNDCTFSFDPASITVPTGTEFTVNWISAATSEVNIDVAKIDAFNAVPIILDMEPGTSYHDEVRVWCGDLFTGTFDFEITSCFDPQYIPVDCGG